MYRIKITNLEIPRYFQQITRNTLHKFPLFTGNRALAKTYSTKKEANKELKEIAKLIASISAETEKDAKARLTLEQEDAE